MNDRMTYVASMAFLAGGIAGAAAALVLAPQSGRATHDRMARKMAEAADSARATKARILQRGAEIRREAEHRVSAAASTLSRGDGHTPGVKPDTGAPV